MSHTAGSCAPGDPWSHLTLESLKSDVRTTVLPDEDDTDGEHPREWLAECLARPWRRGIARVLRQLPYDVVFSARLRARVEANA